MKSCEFLLIASLAVAGCSKRSNPEAEATDQAAVATPEEAAPSGAAESEAPTAPALVTAPTEVYVDNTQFNQDLNAVPDFLKNQEYDAAVANLLMLRQVPKSADQEMAYIRKLEEAAAYLMQQADQDPRAAEARQNLSRAISGR
jgi:hypothetical protein